YIEITLDADLQLVWPINGNLATETPAARIMDVDASGNYELRMPPASQVSVGQDALIRNVGQTTFTVTTYEGDSTIITVSPGIAKYIYLTDNGDVYGTWANVEFGAGTSSADAATLAGAGLLAVGATLNQSHPVSSITVSQAFVNTDRAKTYVWTGGVNTVTLPLSSAVGNNWFFLIKNAGTGTLTVSGSGGEFIDGAATKGFAPTESAFIVCTGTAFVTVGYGVSTQFEYGVLNKTVTGGSYTLTANEAANTIQIYNGTLNQNVTVVVPPIVNFYIISNQCNAGNFTLTFETGAVGASTATVPAGGQASLICDGTNLLNANTTQAGGTTFSLVNGTVSNPSLNFASEANTGIYRPGPGSLGISILANLVLETTATGIDVTGNVGASGTGNFEGGISGGTF
ncbi:MAG: hypothetical protein EBQ80_00830, partial [Proteobacteria bacterium]|nr:hypothetical protein [Pseudomonadota bacterium]